MSNYNSLFLLLYNIGMKWNEKYKRKNSRGSYTSEDLMNALHDLRNNVSLSITVKKYGIPSRTLRRHRDSEVQNPGVIHLGRFKKVMPPELEERLVTEVQNIIDEKSSGLTYSEFGTLAYSIAEENHLEHCFNKERKQAGVHWVKGFLKRHPSLKLRFLRYNKTFQENQKEVERMKLGQC